MKWKCYHGTVPYPTLHITVLELDLLDQLENESSFSHTDGLLDQNNHFLPKL